MGVERLQKGCCCLWAAADVIRHLDVMKMHSSIMHKAVCVCVGGGGVDF